jgi:protein TonB
MNVGGGRYPKLSLRSEQNKRWAKMRAKSTHTGSTPPGSGAKLVTSYFTEGAERETTLKKAGIAALVVHFLAFLLIIPTKSLEIVPLDRTAATVVKRYTPPAPPAKAKQQKKKRTSTPIPIPDPTPDDPEPIEPDDAAYADFGEADEDFAFGMPSGVPGVGLRGSAARAGDGGVMSPEIIRQVDPEYTPDATRRGIQGEVWIEAVVDVDGKVVEPRLLRGLPDEELNRRAMDAIQSWVFRPGMKDGEPIPVIAVFTVTYRLH